MTNWQTFKIIKKGHKIESISSNLELKNQCPPRFIFTFAI